MVGCKGREGKVYGELFIDSHDCMKVEWDGFLWVYACVHVCMYAEGTKARGLGMFVTYLSPPSPYPSQGSKKKSKNSRPPPRLLGNKGSLHIISYPLYRFKDFCLPHYAFPFFTQ